MKCLPPISTIDFETDPFKPDRLPKAFACGFYDGKTYHSIWNSNNEKQVIRKAVEWVRDFPGIVYAHNGGKFDFIGYLFKEAGTLIHGQSVRMIGSRAVQMKFGQADIRDSYAILPGPLKSTGAKGEIDYAWFEKKLRTKHRDVIMAYLKQDCITLHQWCMDFLRIHGTGPLTAASAGMKHLKYLGYKISSLNESKDTKFRAFYFGGNCQAFRKGIFKGSFVQPDIKSAYPNAMTMEHAMSDQFDFIAAPKKVLKTDFVVFRGKADGCFPIRTKDGLMWHSPEVADYRTTGWEYLKAKELGLLKGRVVYVERPVTLASFKRYVDHWFDVKQEAEKAGDTSRRQIAKIMLNAVYGKFAQRPDKYRDYLIVPHDAELSQADLNEGWEEESVDEENGYAVWSMPSSRVPTYYNVATAASITGQVRSVLMEAIHLTSPYVCDTDAVICDKSKVRRLRLGNGLGQWGIEAEGDLLYVGGKKLYALRLTKKWCKDAATADKKGYTWFQGRAWKIASKGVRLNPAEMRKVAMGAVVEYENMAPTFSLKSKPRFIKRKVRRT